MLTKSDNCAQFYNCSRPSSALGSFVEECPVGQLFHITRKQCLSHPEVVCQGRYEPKQVCKLLVTLNIFCLRRFITVQSNAFCWLFLCAITLNPPCILVIFLCSKCSECFLSTMFVEILSVFYYLFLEIIQKFTSTTFLFLEITSNSYHLLMWLYWMFYFLFLFLLHYTISISNCFNDT